MFQPLTGREAYEDLTREAHRLMRRDSALSFSEAVAKAAGLNPELYRRYDAARRREAKHSIAPEHVQPQQASEYQPEGIEAEVRELERELREAAESRGMTFSDYCFSDAAGRRRYAVLDEMTRRAITREQAERTIGGAS